MRRHCNTPQHATTHCNTLLPFETVFIIIKNKNLRAVLISDFQVQAYTCFMYNMYIYVSYLPSMQVHNCIRCSTYIYKITSFYTPIHNFYFIYTYVQGHSPHPLLPRILALQYQCNTLQHATTHCNTLQHNATHCSTLQPCAPLPPP